MHRRWMAVAGDDAGLGDLGYMDPIALRDVQAERTRPAAWTIRNPEALVLRLQAVFPENLVQHVLRNKGGVAGGDSVGHLAVSFANSIAGNNNVWPLLDQHA